MKEITLDTLFDIPAHELSEWTICLNNANAEGVYSFDQDAKRLTEHISWKKGATKRVSFRRITTKYCLQFIRLDKDFKFDEWLFLGAFEVKGCVRHDDGHETYDIVPMEIYSEYVERLIVRFKKKQGPKQAKLSADNLASIAVVRISEKKYINANRPFPGFNSVSLSFQELEYIIHANIDNWRELLSNINAVYCITDMSNGQLYVGSTYGTNGVWQRWSCYVNTHGDGGNVKLKEILAEDGIYNRICSDKRKADDFKFTLLEVFYNRDGNADYIRKREAYWKEVFQTRSFGYNGN